MKDYFEIIVFTASNSLYAEAVVKELDPKGTLITYILHRTHCFETRNGFFIKDLRIIKNRNLKDMIIIDNLVHSFGLQLLNGIPILEWKDDPNDQELKYIQKYLIELSKCNDIRIYNDRFLRIKDILYLENQYMKEVGS